MSIEDSNTTRTQATLIRSSQLPTRTSEQKLITNHPAAITYLTPRTAQPLKIEDSNILDPNSLYKSSSNSPAHAIRQKRAVPPQNMNLRPTVDACQSKMEVLTPYYATNSKGKLRTIVNSELMQQAIQVETCSRTSIQQSTSAPSNRCNAQADCGCEQKYKWHRLLVLDPDGESSATKGLFMDWFLFPSNCVCRCKSSASITTRQFLRAIKQ